SALHRAMDRAARGWPPASRWPLSDRRLSRKERSLRPGGADLADDLGRRFGGRDHGAGAGGDGAAVGESDEHDLDERGHRERGERDVEDALEALAGGGGPPRATPAPDG